MLTQKLVMVGVKWVSQLIPSLGLTKGDSNLILYGNWLIIYSMFSLIWDTSQNKTPQDGIGKVSNKNKKNGWIYPSRLAGWGQQGVKIQPKKNLFKKKYKDDQNGLIHPEN